MSEGRKKEEEFWKILGALYVFEGQGVGAVTCAHRNIPPSSIGIDMASGSRKRKRGTIKPQRAAKKQKTLLPSSAHPSTTLKTFTTQRKQDPNEISLLDLPPELRNTIYELVIADSKTTLATYSGRQYLASSTSLPRVNKQIREEFLGATMLQADIHTISQGLDFQHIVTYLDKLSEMELKTLSRKDLPSHLKFIIHLYPGTNTWTRITLPRRWLRRAGNKTKKGTEVVFEYRCDFDWDDSVPLWSRDRRSTPSGVMRRSLGMAMEGKGGEREGRGGEDSGGFGEVRRIMVGS
ncbi:hypothetical protein LTR86_009753 [Recurvomyces mirabilis]|nr:hypothetical protein LTR86_009753 [Recurvomyces mirabilis]